jgi:hypothetical protein
MTVIVTKEAINLREKLSELDKPSGLTGQALLSADTTAEAVEALDLANQSISTQSITASGSITATGIYLGGSADVLNDYEEGLWTPVYESQSGSFTTMTMFNNLTDKPRYTKIGNLVTVSGYIDTYNVVVGTASGNLYIGGLPFEALISSAGSVTNTSGWAGDNPLTVRVGYQSTRIGIEYRTAVNGDDLSMNVSDLTTGTLLPVNTNGMSFTLTYMTSE